MLFKRKRQRLFLRAFCKRHGERKSIHVEAHRNLLDEAHNQTTLLYIPHVARQTVLIELI